jgi:archaellum biogenesis ATPase FlaH
VSIKDMALACAKMGWYIFPLGEKSKVTDVALAPHSHKSASNDLNQIESWWTASPNANIGIDLGRSNLTVLDFDKGEPPAELNLNGTLRVKTARGTHVYFVGKSKQGDIYFNGAHVGEIKSEGGYVLGPTSIHPDGPVYTIASGDAIHPLPAGLLDSLRGERKAPPSLQGDKILRGSHDNELTRIAGRLRADGLEEEAIYNAIVEVCEKRCENYGTADYKEMCRKIAASVCRYEVGKSTEITFNQKSDVPVVAGATATVKRMSDYKKKKLYWLWQHRIPFGEMTTLAGDPDEGKSLITLGIAADLSQGRKLFGNTETFEPMEVLLLSAEDDPETTLRPRLEAAGADINRVFLLESVVLKDGAGKTLEDRCAQLDTDIQMIEQVLEQNPQIKLIIIDPISSFLGRASINKEQEVRRVLKPLADRARKNRLAVILVAHFNKNSDTRSAMDRVGGAKAIVGMGRAAWTCIREPKRETKEGEPMPVDDPDRRLFLKLKGNLTPSKIGGLVYTIRTKPVEVEGDKGSETMDAPYILWLEETQQTAQEVVIDGKASKGVSKVEAAKAWLQDYLQSVGGHAYVGSIILKAKEAGHGDRTLRRAADLLEVTDGWVGRESHWAMPGCMPKQESNGEPAVKRKHRKRTKSVDLNASE